MFSTPWGAGVCRDGRCFFFVVVESPDQVLPRCCGMKGKKGCNALARVLIVCAGPASRGSGSRKHMRHNTKYYASV